MIRLFYIKYHDSKGGFVARRDYSGLQFATSDISEAFIQTEKAFMEQALGMQLRLIPYFKEIPTFTVKQLIKAYYDITGFEYNDIVGKGRHREKVNIRMFITKTALDLGFVHGQLRPFFDVNSYHYEKTFNDIIESEPVTVELWQGYERKVLSVLGEIYNEDGSGEKWNEQKGRYEKV